MSQPPDDYYVTADELGEPVDWPAPPRAPRWHEEPMVRQFLDNWGGLRPRREDPGHLKGALLGFFGFVAIGVLAVVGWLDPFVAIGIGLGATVAAIVLNFRARSTFWRGVGQGVISGWGMLPVLGSYLFLVVLGDMG